MMFVPHKKHNYRSPRPVTKIALLSGGYFPCRCLQTPVYTGHLPWIRTRRYRANISLRETTGRQHGWTSIGTWQAHIDNAANCIRSLSSLNVWSVTRAGYETRETEIPAFSQENSERLSSFRGLRTTEKNIVIRLSVSHTIR
jgi:hypothetical protein